MKSMSNSETNHQKPRKRTGKRTRALLIVCVLLVIAICAVGFLFARSVLSDARMVKADLREVLSCLREQDADGAAAATDKLEQDAAELDKLLNSPEMSLTAKLPFVQKEITAARALCSLLRDTTDSLLKPAVAFLREYPLSALRDGEGSIDADTVGAIVDFAEEKRGAMIRFAESVDSVNALPFGKLESRFPDLKEELGVAGSAARLIADTTDRVIKPAFDFFRGHPFSELKTESGGLNLELIGAYIEFFEEAGPQMEKLSDQLREFNPGSLDDSGIVDKIRDTFEELMQYYHQAETYLPLVKAFLGNGEDRAYLFAAQNSSEIRASGGFPGAMGMIRIKNGEIIIEDFRPVTGMINYYGSWRSEISTQEIMLFSDWFYAPRDADFCPDYERVASIWAIAYEEEQGERVDGVLAATPAIVQRLLRIVGDIELSDGRVLTDENATRVLEYDLYYDYMGREDNTSVGNDITNELFAETAKTVVGRMMSSLDAQSALKLLKILTESAEDRTLMLWLADEEEQAAVRSAGLDAGLDRDPAKPHAGIYISLNNASRLGWFLDMEPQITELERHEDGSRVYSVTVELTNTMTQEEIDRASSYITGYPRGVFTGLIHLFAPAGGTIQNVETTGNLFFAYDEYHDLQLAYAKNIYLNPGDSVTITYTLTTAACEQEDLGLSITPTLTDYR